MIFSALHPIFSAVHPNGRTVFLSITDPYCRLCNIKIIRLISSCVTKLAGKLAEGQRST